MKKITYTSLFLLLAIGLQAQPFKSATYPTGVFVFCGKEIPKTFTYLIEKQVAGQWQAAAELRAPKNEAACKAALMSLPESLASLTAINDAQIRLVWQQLQKSTWIDSLYAYSTDPKMQFTAGCGWFDDGLQPGLSVRYRISKINKNEETTVLREELIMFPGNPFKATLNVVRFVPGGNTVRISYAMSDSVNTSGLRLFRSLFRKNQYSEVVPNTFFTREKGKIVARVTDASVAEGLAYSYVAVPFDVLGNKGIPSDTINIYNLRKISEIGMVEQLDAIAYEAKKGIDLKWKIGSDLNLQSVEIYRSQVYEGPYRKIASVPASATSYFDNVKLAPAKAYFYYIVANNGYGNNLPSARTPAILKGSKPNFLPPQGLAAVRNGNIVTLTLKKVEPDTRGYYVYRADGYTGPLTQLPQMILSADSNITFRDTLQFTATPQIYTYAVADVNSSYKVSPASERVSVQYSGGMLPVPMGVEAMLLDGNVLVTWKDAAALNAAVSRYRVYRTTLDVSGKSLEDSKLMAVIPYDHNSYTDSTVSDGLHYLYSVQSVGMDDNDLSSKSLVAGVQLPQRMPMQAGQVTAMAADKKILLRWDQPSDNTITKVRIYRAQAGQKASLLKELPATQSSYTDGTAITDIMYFYYVVMVNAKGDESKPDTPVSAQAR